MDAPFSDDEAVNILDLVTRLQESGKGDEADRLLKSLSADAWQRVDRLQRYLKQQYRFGAS